VLHPWRGADRAARDSREAGNPVLEIETRKRGRLPCHRLPKGIPDIETGVIKSQAVD
jgi:hypothetical protein